MKILPDWIYFNKKTYHLFKKKFEDNSLGTYYSYYYAENEDSIPPEVTDGKEYYFLGTTEHSKIEAYNELLSKINNMKPWLR